MSRYRPVWLVGVVLVCCCGATPGCGEKQSAPRSASEAGPPGGAQDARAEPKAEPAAANAPAQAPMIVYTATLDVIVKDLEAAAAEVDKLVAAHKGFVAKSEVKGERGSPRVATYTARVPVAAFNALKEGVVALGVAERNLIDTQDVTEEFVDVEARIKNLKDQEDKLNELLKEKRKEEKLDDVIKVSDRVFLVRGDIERAQGRQNYLQNRAQLSTLNITLREVKDYKPPTAPTFGTRIGQTFAASWDAVLEFGKGLVLLVVALVPWAPLWIPALVATVWVVRRLRRAAREAAREPEPRPRRPRAHSIPDTEPPAEPVKPPEPPA